MSMKKICKKYGVMALALVLGLGIIVTMILALPQDVVIPTTSTYEVPAVVVEMNDETGWVTFVDWANETWYIRGSGYVPGQLIVAVFDDNGTPDTIYDDMVVDILCHSIAILEEEVPR